MKCPFCGCDDTRVVDSRPADDNASIRRRRVCDDCGKRFTTYEKVETIPLIVIKKDNNREAYNRRKIEDGILRACHKRPVSAADLTRIVDEVETEVFKLEGDTKLCDRKPCDGKTQGYRRCCLCKICIRLQGIQGCEYVYGRA